MFDEKNIRAEVYKKTDKDIYYVKVKILDLGMYICGITVRQSPKNPDGLLWVQMPYYGQFKKYIEWDGADNQLKNIIEIRSRYAVEAFNNKQKQGGSSGRGP